MAIDSSKGMSQPWLAWAVGERLGVLLRVQEPAVYGLRFSGQMNSAASILDSLHLHTSGTRKLTLAEALLWASSCHSSSAPAENRGTGGAAWELGTMEGTHGRVEANALWQNEGSCEIHSHRVCREQTVE